MSRASGPQNRIQTVLGFTPGWYESGRWPSEPEPYRPGAPPPAQSGMNRAAGPQNEIQTSPEASPPPQSGMSRASGPQNRIETSVLSAEGASSYQPGAKPRVCMEQQEPRAEGPHHRALMRSR